ncbi:sodium-dependent inorganic phosphate (Pi) transporter [Variovorax sp. PBS-H4]|uniref:Na/Pi cotransporter family protein n=1 Tax=Variovorax sp. PBS-H4 TaxID=434008 RepID=UPI001316E064|nr:Na/Pi cotransporter family protein [Variovorax sp. PBS-H4]VTU41183.1 sodium-dependent inorganic phosphate (Pi) transporter [Variovorax sp. PBS-H4]
MIHLLNLLAAIALLVWGTSIVRTGVIQIFGANLRGVLARNLKNRFLAMLAGMTVTGVVQSSTATAVLISSFVGNGLVGLPTGLAVMLGAEVGTSLMAVVFSFDLSWLSPMLVLVGVVLVTGAGKRPSGRVGHVLIGFGLITLGLQLIVTATQPLLGSSTFRSLVLVLPDDVMLEIIVGALLTMATYSSLAFVLLSATLSASGVLPMQMALGLVLGANLGSGILAMLTSSGPRAVRLRLPLGSLLFKLLGCAVAVPMLPQIELLLQQNIASAHAQVIAFHLGFNVVRALFLIGLTGPMAKVVEILLPTPSLPVGEIRPRHLDPGALATPSLAISCAAREALHQADVVEAMLAGILPVLRNADLTLAEQLRKMDDTVDELYSAIKFYLTQISQDALSEQEGRRWSNIVSFTIHMEQVGDVIEHVVQDIEDKQIRKSNRFSDAGMAEIVDLHTRLIANLRLAMSVFLDGQVRDAKKLLEEKARFRDLEHAYAVNHLARLQTQTTQSIETSSLHLDLISDLKRINSHICSIAYPILEAAGALTKTRIRHSHVGLAATSNEPVA